MKRRTGSGSLHGSFYDHYIDHYMINTGSEHYMVINAAWLRPPRPKCKTCEDYRRAIRNSDYVFKSEHYDTGCRSQEVATCSILSIEEMCDDAKNTNKGEEAEDNVHADEAELSPMSSLSDSIMVF
ncbi:hypothetical protein NPIL_698661 [Nephila pilipes]|uniref:Uncharacterized protein n=1 Tax=Nephila pilipes TaxID=299642 RepID=A0A8X6TQ48_NEPPI|nr:hypothetical protein NPIL_698661 [Nephila pilipes]